MNGSTVTALARRPIVQTIDSLYVFNELQESANDQDRRLISVYIPDAGAQIMFRGLGGKLEWAGSWSPITKERAIECAREQAYDYGIDAEQNLFYIPCRLGNEKSGYLWADVDAGSECLDVDTLDKYQDRGDDCLVVLYDPAQQEVQKYRIRNNDLDWWWKSRPHTLKDAKRMAIDDREEHGLTFDAVRFHECKA